MPLNDAGRRVDNLTDGSVAVVFAALFDTHAAALHRYLSARVGAAVADDLVSDTFVLAIRRRETFDPDRGSARAWLFGIATNQLRHHHREQARHWAGAARLAASEVVAPNGMDDAETRLDAAAIVRRLVPDLLLLSDIDRDILLLNAWAGLEPGQIAEALDLPAGTVRSKLSRLRRQLRRVPLDPAVVELRPGRSAASTLGASHEI